MPTNRWRRTSKNTNISFFFILILYSIIKFTLTVWNPTIHPVVHHVRIPVVADYSVRDPTGQNVTVESNQNEHFFFITQSLF